MNSEKNSQQIILLAMHGMPPTDFPQDEKRELMRLHTQIHQQTLTPDQVTRHDELDHKMRQWPRTPQNDSFHQASHEIAKQMSDTSNLEVIVGFNEFCTPSVEEALEQAAQSGAKHVIVVTPMVTRGGNHSEEEIPEAVEKAKKNHPDVKFDYAWPIDSHDTAEFLLKQIEKISV